MLPAELATCEHSRSRQRGPGTRQASGRPLPAPGGDPTSVPCLDKAYECLQTYPGPGGCGRADAQPRKGPVRGTVLLSGVRGVKPAALTTGCSIPDSPLQSAPLPTVGCSHICHPLGPAEPVPEGAGSTRWSASTAPGAGAAARHCWHRSRGDTATCCPRAAGWARRAAASHLGLQGTSPGPPAPQCLAAPREPSVAVTCSGPGALHCSAASIVLQHPAQRCLAPSTMMPSSLHGNAIPPCPPRQAGCPPPRGASPPQSRHWGQALLTLVAGRLQAGVQAGCGQMHCV